MQFLLPVVLVRCLDAATFGEYRLLWLVVGTVMTRRHAQHGGRAVLSSCRARTPRSKRLYVHQTLLFLAAVGPAVAARWSAPGTRCCRPAVAPLQEYGALVPAFVALWMRRARCSTRCRRSTSASAGRPTPRSAPRCCAPCWSAPAPGSTGEIARDPVAAARRGAGQARAAARLRARAITAWARPWFERARVRRPVPPARAVRPVERALRAARAGRPVGRGERCSRCHSFAAFSIAAVLGPLVHIFRHSVIEAFLPSMSRCRPRATCAA